MKNIIDFLRCFFLNSHTWFTEDRGEVNVIWCKHCKSVIRIVEVPNKSTELIDWSKRKIRDSDGREYQLVHTKWIPIGGKK